MEPYESLAELTDEKLPFVPRCPVCKEGFITSSDEEDHAWLHIDQTQLKRKESK